MSSDPTAADAPALAGQALYVTNALRQAVAESELSDKDIATAVGASTATISALFSYRKQVPHTNGVNAVVSAMCRLIQFPVNQALTPMRPVKKARGQMRDIDEVEIEARYRRELANIRSRR